MYKESFIESTRNGVISDTIKFLMWFWRFEVEGILWRPIFPPVKQIASILEWSLLSDFFLSPFTLVTAYMSGSLWRSFFWKMHSIPFPFLPVLSVIRHATQTLTKIWPFSHSCVIFALDPTASISPKLPLAGAGKVEERRQPELQ